MYELKGDMLYGVYVNFIIVTVTVEKEQLPAMLCVAISSSTQIL
jgi:hypothetical protein